MKGKKIKDGKLHGYRLVDIPGLRWKGLQMTKRPSLGALTAPNWQAPNGCIAVLIIACSANCQNLSVADVQETGVCWGNLCVAALDSKQKFRRPPDFRNSSLSWKQCSKALRTFCVIS